jgi:hypothetical protein
MLLAAAVCTRRWHLLAPFAARLALFSLAQCCVLRVWLHSCPAADCAAAALLLCPVPLGLPCCSSATPTICCGPINLLGGMKRNKSTRHGWRLEVLKWRLRAITLLHKHGLTVAAGRPVEHRHTGQVCVTVCCRQLSRGDGRRSTPCFADRCALPVLGPGLILWLKARHLAAPVLLLPRQLPAELLCALTMGRTCRLRQNSGDVAGNA